MIIEQAIAAHLNSQTNFASEQRRVDDVIALNEWRVFTNRHLRELTGVPSIFIEELTGLRFSDSEWFLVPENLPFIQQVIGLRKERKWKDAKAVAQYVMDCGTDSPILSRLTKIPKSTLTRWNEQ